MGTIMVIDFSELQYLQDPDLLTLKSDYDQFLMSICGPTVIDVSGKDQSRTRVITTLIHGNEPSGLIAIHRWLSQLKANVRPETNLRFIICSPEAASLSPLFSHRYLPSGLDLNRCFGHSSNSQVIPLKQGYYQRAKLIKQAIYKVSPEVVVDLHNTSGFSPAFSVSIAKQEMALSLTALFCRSLILSDLRLGALMEQDFGCEAITIECGGSKDVQSHEVAYRGIKALATKNDINLCHQNTKVDIFLKPLRLQLKKNIPLSYSLVDEGRSGLSLTSNIEQHNFGIIQKHQMLGWLDDKGLENLEIIAPNGKNVIYEYFTMRSNQLVANKDLNIFMATKNHAIAKGDCLFYLVSAHNHL